MPHRKSHLRVLFMALDLANLLVWYATFVWLLFSPSFTTLLVSVLCFFASYRIMLALDWRAHCSKKHGLRSETA